MKHEPQDAAAVKVRGRCHQSNSWTVYRRYDESSSSVQPCVLNTMCSFLLTESRMTSCSHFSSGRLSQTGWMNTNPLVYGTHVVYPTHSDTLSATWQLEVFSHHGNSLQSGNDTSFLSCGDWRPPCVMCYSVNISSCILYGTIYPRMAIVRFQLLVRVFAWNSLPPHVTSASSVNIFKTRLK